MARFARVVVPGYPYHVTHRGNRGTDLFFLAEDRDVYRQWLSEYAKEFRLEIWAYCLMANHVHLLAVPRRKDSLAMAVGRTHMRYARRINRRQGLTGHLWANRYYSTILDQSHLWAAVKYIETNPVRAKIVTQAADYEWPSARSHAHGRPDSLLSPRRPFPDPKSVGNWAHWLAGDLEAAFMDNLRKNTNTGRPCGTNAFIKRLEKRLGRLLTPQKAGRKPGKKKNT